MQLLIKIFCFAIVILVTALPVNLIASPTNKPPLTDEFGEIDEDENSPATYEMLCEVRKMFCGSTAVAIITFVILSIGFLILKGKITWGYVIVLLTGCIVFVGAANVTKILAQPPAGLGVVNACKC
jgi:type IV secretory pathway VirB2 component (pilin)